MSELSPLHQQYLSLLGHLFLLTYWSTLRRWLGASVSRYVKGGTGLLAFVALVSDAPLLLLGLLFCLALLVQLVYWYARRKSYNTFIPDKAPALPPNSLTPLPADQRIRLQATGIFSVNNREGSVLLAPAEYWQVPLGEHVVMVEQAPGHYLYQFFNGRTVQSVTHGWLVFGQTPRRALAVTFMLSRGSEYAEYGQLYFVPGKPQSLPPQTRTIYLSFADEQDRQQVWHNIVHDARRVRQG